ncbi:MAG TPA: SRPBCC family protein [Devosiaceae bacterium]
MTAVIVAIVILIIALLIYAATKPKTFRMERSTTIEAPPDKVFSLIDNFHNWTQWSPWENVDPNLQRSYDGPDNGKGAIYAYEGNSKVGAGRMEIVESNPSSKVLATLDFIKPMQAHNFAEFTLRPSGSGTNVTWAMYGPMPYMHRLMTTFLSMDKMIGKDFERGLANLKAAAETETSGA